MLSVLAGSIRLSGAFKSTQVLTPGVSTALTRRGVYVCVGPCRYISTVKQANASAAAAVVNCGMFVLSGVLILVSVYAVSAMGIGPFFTLLAGLQLLVAAVAAACIVRDFRRTKSQQKPPTADSTSVGAAGAV